MNAPLALSWMAWIAPPALLLSAALIASKLTWRGQPALMAFLLAESGIQIAMSCGWMVREWAILLQLVVASTWLLGEMVAINNIPLHPRTMALIASLAIAACALHAGSQPWTIDYRLSLFRSDVRIARAVEAASILVFRWMVPAFARQEQTRINKAYTIGVTAWLIVEAVQGAFVRGGLGVAILSYTPQRWVWVGLVSYAGVIAAAVGTALAMWVQLPGRKHSAIDARRGKAVVGRIEQRAA